MANRLALSLAAGFLLFVAGCGERLTEEEQLRQTLAQMQTALQKRDISSFMEHIAEDYADDHGRTALDIRRIAQLHVLRNKNLHIFRHITQLDFSDSGQAQAVILVAVARQPIESLEALKNLRAELLEFKVRFVHADTWQATSAQWRAVSIGAFF